jgi:hypothetical protein
MNACRTGTTLTTLSVGTCIIPTTVTATITGH